jgi:hypothetical protein
MKGLSKGKSVLLGTLAAFVASAPVASQASSTDVSVVTRSDETHASPAAIKIIKRKAMKAEVRTAQFVRESGPSWVQSGSGSKTQQSKQLKGQKSQQQQK